VSAGEKQQSSTEVNWNPILWLSALVLAVGGLNWGLVGLFEFDLVAELFGEEFGSTNTASRIVYVLVGASAVVMLGSLAAAQMGESRSLQQSREPRA
jgi:uncharacterized membrane protein YuzA (DUF378 family)